MSYWRGDSETGGEEYCDHLTLAVHDYIVDAPSSAFGGLLIKARTRAISPSIMGEARCRSLLNMVPENVRQVFFFGWNDDDGF